MAKKETGKVINPKMKHLNSKIDKELIIKMRVCCAKRELKIQEFITRAITNGMLPGNTVGSRCPANNAVGTQKIMAALNSKVDKDVLVDMKVYCAKRELKIQDFLTSVIRNELLAMGETL